MRALVAGDNRDCLNWGCRATSLSLLDIVSRHARIEDTIKLRETVTTLTAWPLAPAILAASGTRRILTAIDSRTLRFPLLNTAFRSVFDTVSEHPEKALNHILRRRKSSPEIDRLLGRFEAADLIVINGEGNMIFTTPPRRPLLFQMLCIEIAARFGKPVHLVNGMVSACSRDGINDSTVSGIRPTLDKLTTWAVRDPFSLHLAETLFPGQKIRFIPDALFLQANQPMIPLETMREYPELFQGPSEAFPQAPMRGIEPPYICVTGASRPPAAPVQGLVAQYEALVHALRTSTGLPVILIATCMGDDFLADVAYRTQAPFIPVATGIHAGMAILGHCSAFVTGRYHPAIMASCHGTPCVFMQSNSHKTSSLQQLLSYSNAPVFTPDSLTGHTDEIARLCMSLIAKGSTLRDSIVERSRTLAQKLSAYGMLFSDQAMAVNSAGANHSEHRG